MSTVHILLVLCAVFAGVLVASEARQLRGVKIVSKTGAALCFVLAGVFAAPALTGAAGWLVGALVLSALGDVLLLPKGAGASFVAGLVSFLLAHVLFVVALVVAGASLLYAGMMLVAFVPVGLFVLRWLWPHLSRRMRGPVVAYVLVITMMASTALGFFVEQRTLGALVAFTAALLFFLSDICVARERFVVSAFPNKLLGLPLYFGAQIVWVVWLEQLGS